MIAEGTYRSKATNWMMSEASTGTVQVAIEFTLQDFESPPIWFYGSLSEKAWTYTVDNMRTCGWKGDDLATLTGPGDESGLDANEVYIVVVHEEYNGTTRAKVKYINASPVKNQMTGDKLKSFAERMRGQIMARDQQTGAKNSGAPPRPSFQKRAPSSPSPVAPEDDIPF